MGSDSASTCGFGLPPIEAMHFGKPVYLARRTCLPEIGGFAADDFDDFDDFHASAMRRIVETGLIRQRQPGCADAIRKHAVQFDWDRTAAADLGLYRRVLGLPPGSSAACPFNADFTAVPGPAAPHRSRRRGRLQGKAELLWISIHVRV